MLKRTPFLLASTVLAVAALGACSGDDDATGVTDGSEPTVVDDTSVDTSTADTSESDETDATTQDSTASGDHSDDDYVAAFAEALSEPEGIDDDQGECVASDWIGIIGTDRLAENDIAPDDVSGSSPAFDQLGVDASEADAMATAMLDCGIDVPGIVVDTNSLEGETAKCVREEIPAEALARTLTYSIMSVEIPQDLREQQSACTPSN